ARQWRASASASARLAEGQRPRRGPRHWRAAKAAGGGAGGLAQSVGAGRRSDCPHPGQQASHPPLRSGITIEEVGMVGRLLGLRRGLGVLGLGCAGGPDRDEPPAPTTTQELHQAIADVLEDTHPPGAGVALVSRDRILWSAGVGLADRAAERAVSLDTL